jgi:hypothetical protein
MLVPGKLPAAEYMEAESGRRGSNNTVEVRRSTSWAT